MTPSLITRGGATASRATLSTSGGDAGGYA